MDADRHKAFVSWSSGKDSAFALWEARRSGLADIAGVLTTVNESFDRVAMHGVRRDLLARQVAALGLPCIEVPLPYPCPNNEYEIRMAAAVGTSRPKASVISCLATCFWKTSAPIARISWPPPECMGCFRCGDAIRAYSLMR